MTRPPIINEKIPLWRQIQKTNFTRLEPLIQFLQISEENQKNLLDRPRFALNVPKRLAAKMEKNSLIDPLFRQFVPLIEETQDSLGILEPLREGQFRKSQKLLHKYEGRALFLTTSACAMHCRYCFRQNFPYETEEKSFDQELAYLAGSPTLTEVILSGGDPLSLSDQTLGSLFEKLEEIRHIRRIRFHTRFPIGIPERIDDSFLAVLKKSSKQVIMIIHCNHPREIDEDVAQSLKKIQNLGIPVLNQSVLLKGVNDDEKTLLCLSETLVNIGIIPYYLHLLDPVLGAGHFESSEARALQLIQHLQENLSGYGVPRLVREEPGKPSKTFRG